MKDNPVVLLILDMFPEDDVKRNEPIVCHIVPIHQDGSYGHSVQCHSARGAMSYANGWERGQPGGLSLFRTEGFCRMLETERCLAELEHGRTTAMEESINARIPQES